MKKRKLPSVASLFARGTRIRNNASVAQGRYTQFGLTPKITKKGFEHIITPDGQECLIIDESCLETGMIKGYPLIGKGLSKKSAWSNICLRLDKLENSSQLIAVLTSDPEAPSLKDIKIFKFTNGGFENTHDGYGEPGQKMQIWLTSIETDRKSNNVPIVTKS